jgi:hypothetical protein
MLRSLVNNALRSRSGGGYGAPRGGAPRGGGYGGGGFGGGRGGGRNAMMGAGLGMLAQRFMRRR